MGRKGIALVAVLWGLLLAGTIALSFSLAMRTEAKGAGYGAGEARSYYRARTGLSRAVALFAALPPEEAARREIRESDDDGGYEVSVEDESGRIDVNRAPVEEIRDALERSGMGPGEAEALASAVLGWRSPEEDPSVRGALDDACAALPEPVTPRHGELASLDELRSLPGVSEDAWRRILSRIFTVHGGSSQVNANAASPAVLRALGLTEEQAGRLVAERESEPFRTQARLSALLSREGVPAAVGRRLSVGPSSRVFTLTARGREGDGPVRAVRCRIAAEGAKGGPVRILRWEDLVAAGEPS